MMPKMKKLRWKDEDVWTSDINDSLRYVLEEEKDKMVRRKVAKSKEE